MHVMLEVDVAMEKTCNNSLQVSIRGLEEGRAKSISGLEKSTNCTKIQDMMHLVGLQQLACTIL